MTRLFRDYPVTIMFVVIMVLLVAAFSIVAVRVQDDLDARCADQKRSWETTRLLIVRAPPGDRVRLLGLLDGRPDC